ncbi:uncharacterized protein SPPG_07833 [Spizellomyces punctatus DAOM BR117]|uniref:J domain-containing protein n=1 Tax=Spizellomyces punctatus (strain DAOM BR117) TaxID=645134 RepID=A0A0L0H8L5_SPIPD|nr:uncharacterized protein SPPG_07833 [Spizellomyces punctatus DAOM BR117]KNC97018.1 hypothetical protein SPPG_07833 [Spizellomyces punctatus DAOM BR117]|eukprot:XP_016605058.1 hypothetical protein SPPG_07833 [Spizellomyces punctatus DAOM BR117]
MPEAVPTTLSNEDEQTISDILHQECFYARIGVSKNATPQQIRRGYLSRSKICHPDRLRHPRAKEAFQRLSNAYSTLSDPFNRRQYDMFGKQIDGNEQTFYDALNQVFSEFLEGHFETLMRLVDHVQSLNPDFHISKEGTRHVLSSMRDFCLWSGRCWGTVKFELITLYEIHMDIQSLSYFDVKGRFLKSGVLSRGIIALMGRLIPGGGGLMVHCL